MTAEQIVAKSFDTGSVNERIQAATAQGAIVNADALAFAERVGELLLMALNDGDNRMGQQALLLVRMRRMSDEVGLK